MQVSGKGAAIGLAVDLFTGLFPVGTAIGAFANNLKGLLKLDNKDMGTAYDANRAQKQGFDWSTMDFSKLKTAFEAKDWDKMKSELTGMARSIFGPPKEGAPLRPDTESPTAETEARQMAKKSGMPTWGKALLIGGGVLAGLHVVGKVLPFMMFGFPFYGAAGMMPGMFF